MKTSYRLPVLMAAGLLMAAANAAQAQQSGIQNLRDIEDDNAIVQPFGISADELEDMDIVGIDGDEIGEVEDVLIDDNGNISISAEVGGFLGIGQKEVLIAADQLALGNDNDNLVTTMTKEQIEALPEWND